MYYREVIYLIGKPSFSAFWRSKDIGRDLTLGWAKSENFKIVVHV